MYVINKYSYVCQGEMGWRPEERVYLLWLVQVFDFHIHLLNLNPKVRVRGKPLSCFMDAPRGVGISLLVSN